MTGRLAVKETNGMSHTRSVNAFSKYHGLRQTTDDRREGDKIKKIYRTSTLFLSIDIWRWAWRRGFSIVTHSPSSFLPIPLPNNNRQIITEPQLSRQIAPTQARYPVPPWSGSRIPRQQQQRNRWRRKSRWWASIISTAFLISTKATGPALSTYIFHHSHSRCNYYYYYYYYILF